MSNIVIFGATQSGKTTLLGFLSTAMIRHPQLNEEICKRLKLIKKLTIDDEFSIGNPYNPINVNKSIILPSFVSLDKNELKKFRDQSSIGTTKRLHRKQLSICMSERDKIGNNQNENESISCTFVDLPGFRQKLSDKYRGFFEGDIGIAVLKLGELVELYNLKKGTLTEETINKIDYYENRLFEPIRVWCDYRSPLHLVIAISQIDRSFDEMNNFEDSRRMQIEDINKAIECIKENTDRYNDIPISPISIKLTSERNTKEKPRMSVFFHRVDENIYKDDHLPGSGSFISCLKKVMPSIENNTNLTFSMGRVYKIMKAIVNGAPRTTVNVRAMHGSIHKSDRVMLGPIVDKIHDAIVFAECEISSIKADGAKEPSDVLFEGNVGGIIFNSIRNVDSHYNYHISFINNESDITMLDSTILFCGEVKQGNIVELEIPKSEYITLNGGVDEIYSRVLQSLIPFDQVYLLWYGIMVSVNIVEISSEDKKFCISTIISKCDQKSLNRFVLPINNCGKIKYRDNVLLAIPRSYYSTLPPGQVQNKFTYVNCYISDIKNSSDFDILRIEANNCMCICSVLAETVHFDCINSEEELDVLSVPIKSSNKRIDIYSILTKIGRNIKKWFSRQSYRQFGGVKITLLNSENHIEESTSQNLNN